MKKSIGFLFVVSLLLFVSSCKNEGNGELRDIKQKYWSEPNPYGMIFIEKGSFDMGPNDQNAFWAFNSLNKKVTVESFFMDESEITNSEYKQFVGWVKDSVVRNFIFQHIKDNTNNNNSYPSLNSALNLNSAAGGPSTLTNQEIKLLESTIDLFQTVDNKQKLVFFRTRGMRKIPSINWDVAFDETRFKQHLSSYLTDTLVQASGGGGGALTMSSNILIHQLIKPYFTKFYREDPVNGQRIDLTNNVFIGSQFNTDLLNYSYSWIDYSQASLKRNQFDPLAGQYKNPSTKFQEKFGRPLQDSDSTRVPEYFVRTLNTSVGANGKISNWSKMVQLTSRNDFVMSKTLQVYPDTLAIIRDFSYFSYNEPIAKMYFSHPGYSNYPVVGVTWEQAEAFCNWRTNLKNSFQARVGEPIVQDYRLPLESEWEYAARGGRRSAMYPWGGYYTRKANGCFMANFKPGAGEYVDDNYIYPAEIKSYEPNDFGLFDMAGNVSEWTLSSYKENTLAFAHDLNPDYQYNATENDPPALKRKVVKGGSWKDIGFFLQCGQKTFELQDEGRSYIGFRCVRSFIGPY